MNRKLFSPALTCGPRLIGDCSKSTRRLRFSKPFWRRARATGPARRCWIYGDPNEKGSSDTHAAFGGFDSAGIRGEIVGDARRRRVGAEKFKKLFRKKSPVGDRSRKSEV